MEYASWVTAEIKTDHEPVPDRRSANDAAIILEKLLESENTGKALSSFKRSGYKAFSPEFIEKLVYPIYLALKRPGYTHLTPADIKHYADAGIDLVKKLNNIIRKFDLDQDLTFWLPMEVRLSKGDKSLFPDELDVVREVEHEKIMLSDALNELVTRSLERIKEEVPVVEKPNASSRSVEEPDRVYFIRTLYFNFMKYFGEPHKTPIRELANVFFEEDVTEYMVVGGIRRYQEELKKTSMWDFITETEVNKREHFPKED